MRGLRVKPHKGFIHYYKPRGVQPRRYYCKLLLHSVGIGGNRLCQAIGQLKGIGIFFNARRAVLCADTENIRYEIKVFNSAHKIV